jgi:gamma-glutamylaminecyclotransferase
MTDPRPSLPPLPSPAPLPPSSLPPPTAYVFVYGTLKRGGLNHARMAGQRFLGEARTRAGRTLYSLGEYPGLVLDPADREGVVGELWAVEAEALAALDAFEGVAEGLYARVPAELAAWSPEITAAQAAQAQLYLYLGAVHGRPHLGSSWSG